MRQERFTDPFTGQTFKATVEDDGSISVSNPITHAIYNFKVHGNAITIPLELFDYVELMTVGQVADFLEVSHQRVSQLLSIGRIPCTKVGGKRMVRLADAIRYKQLRKIGRPSKEEQWI